MEKKEDIFCASLVKTFCCLARTQRRAIHVEVFIELLHVTSLIRAKT